MPVLKWSALVALLFAAFTVQAGLHPGLKLVSDGLERSYDLYVPDRPARAERPLVLLYHGHFGSSDVMTGANGKKAPYKGWLRLAQRDNFLVAIPNGEKGADGKRGWNDCRADTTTNPTTDDVKFTLQLIEAVHRQHPVDRSRIHATGTSNGGNMVIRLAMEVPEQFAAVAASNPIDNECREQRQAISILFMNGTADPLLPYQGGRVGKEQHGRGAALSTPNSVAYWIEVNGAQETPNRFQLADRDARDRSSVIRHSHANHSNNTEAILYEVVNGGHTEPSGQERYRRLYKRIVGNQNHDIEMAEEVWRFFAAKSR